MKLTVTLVVDRPGGEHGAKIEYEIEDLVIGHPAAAMLTALPITAELLDGIMFLIGHECAEDGTEEVPEAFRRAFET